MQPMMRLCDGSPNTTGLMNGDQPTQHASPTIGTKRRKTRLHGSAMSDALTSTGTMGRIDHHAVHCIDFRLDSEGLTTCTYSAERLVECLSA